MLNVSPTLVLNTHNLETRLHALRCPGKRELFFNTTPLRSWNRLKTGIADIWHQEEGSSVPLCIAEGSAHISPSLNNIISIMGRCDPSEHLWPGPGYNAPHSWNPGEWEWNTGRLQQAMFLHMGKIFQAQPQSGNFWFLPSLRGGLNPHPPEQNIEG